MNRYLFAARNISDKGRKMLSTPGTFRFYLNTYVLSRLEGIRPDVYIVSYPKCGRTWLRYLLQNYFAATGTPVRHFRDSSVQAPEGGPVIKFEHDLGNWVPAPSKLSSLAFNATKYKDSKVIFLVRDPRDTLVSSWFHLTFREQVYRRSLSEFIRDDVLGISKVVAFTNMWISHRQVPESFLLLTYEQFHRDAVSHFRTMLEFAGLPADRLATEKAVQESSFRKMQSSEKEGKLREPWMKPGSRNSEKSLKVRRGKVGSYRNELSDEDIRFLDNFIERELTPDLQRYYGASATPP
jgi:hypothetical protein